jgi:hypothetical protein
LFFDEARFGTHAKISYGWFKKGKRTPVKVKIGYKAFYVYGAISAKTGSNYSISFPNVNTESMNEFLKNSFEKLFLSKKLQSLWTEPVSTDQKILKFLKTWISFFASLLSGVESGGTILEISETKCSAQQIIPNTRVTLLSL